jgi:trk system potassium uptake protein TrkA
MHVVIIGCGRVGSLLADRLDGEGASVAVVDRDPKARRRLSNGFRGRFVEGNGFSRPTLDAARLGVADAMVAVSRGDNCNIVAARIARDHYRVPKVVARIYDPRRSDLYRELGIVTVASSRWASNQIHLLLHRRELEPELVFGGGETILMRAELPATLGARRVGDLAIEGEISVVEITRAGRSVLPGPETVLRVGDFVSFAVATGSIGRLRGFLGQETAT